MEKNPHWSTDGLRRKQDFKPNVQKLWAT